MRHRHVCLSAFSAETGRQLHDYYIIQLSFYQWLFPKNSHYFRKSPKQCFYGAVAHQAVNQFYLSILLFLSRIQSFIVNIGAKSRDIFAARRYVAVCRDKQPADRFISVVSPAPFIPTSAIFSPRFILNDIWSRISASEFGKRKQTS